MLRTGLLLTSLALFGGITCAQAPVLDALNERFAPVVTFRTDRQQHLVIDIHDQSERIRQDVVDPLDLDPGSITYSQEEDGVVLKCREERVQCISKEIFKLDVVRLTSRVTIPKPADDPDGATSMELLRAWVETTQKAGDQALSGTPSKPLRKNGR